MSETTIDLAKVTQMLDSGWHVQLFKNLMGSYSANAVHADSRQLHRANEKLSDVLRQLGHDSEVIAESIDDDCIETDDFTPEQALTRLAYKVHGEIISN